MRVVPTVMTDRWKSQVKTGAQRPVVRATIQKVNLKKFDYDTAWSNGGSFDTTRDRHTRGVFTSIVFGDASPVLEIRNIQSYTWTRSVDQDVATCKIVLLNTELQPLDQASVTEGANDFDMPGHMTYNRGEQTIAQNRWGYDTQTGWNNVFVPDRMVRTFEGYGADPTVPPALDENLVQSGTWLIDKVTYGSDGMIELEMRDVGRMLLDQIVFPPVIPYVDYPLTWSRIRVENVPARDCKGGSWKELKGKGKAISSNNEYIGKGLTNPPFKHYVGPNGGFNGHTAGHALENDKEFVIDPTLPHGWEGSAGYWLSTGQTTKDSKVWWQVNLNDKSTAMAGVRIHPHGGPYRVYVSLKGPKGWIGKKRIPYKVTTEGIDNGSDIPFVATAITDMGRPFDIILKRKYASIQAVRITFTHLWDTVVGQYPWRAGLRDVMLYTAPNVGDLSFGRGLKLKVVGNYGDYTQIIKWVCCWGGFFWPPHDTGLDFVNLGEGQHQTISYGKADRVLPKGRAWGEFMRSGTVGQADLTVDLFDKKPLMDVINYVRDLLGFLFFIDEMGLVQWRQPNLWKLGNYKSPARLGDPTVNRTSTIITLDEEETLLSYSTRLDSGSLRERIFVANSTGKIGTVIRGFTPTFSGHGFRRMAGWTDQHFDTKQETRVMADMIAARQMFEYRRSQATIPGYPAIQIDDQIRIFERVTNETYYHYVMGITSNLDMESGEWTYDLETHWLGERPEDAWVVKVDQLDGVTKAYINAVNFGD